MSLPLMRKQFIKHGLAVAAASLAASSVYAGTNEQQEIQQLRAEVAELRALIQQQVANSPKAPQPQTRPAVIAPAPVMARADVPPSPAENKKPGWFTLPDGQTQVKLYGSIRTDATYDFEGTNSSTASISNQTNKVPLNSANGTKDALNVSAATSRIGLDFARPSPIGEITGKLEADFMGSSSGTNDDGSFRVRHAYVSVGKWLAGQTTSPFVNTETAPETVDFRGPMGYGSTRTVQVRYTQPINANQKVLLAVEGGDIDKYTTDTILSSNGTTASGGHRLPAVTARYDYKTDDNRFLGQVHALLHEVRVSTNNSNDEEKMGWGVGLGAKYKLTDADTIFANYYHVKGDTRYLLYTNPAYVVSKNADGSLSISESEFDSALIGYSHVWSPKLRSTLAAGGIWYNNDNGYARFASSSATASATRDTLNKTMYNIIVNSFYSPTKNIDLGVEYTYGQRKIFEQLDTSKSDTGDYSRLNLMAKYSF